MVNRVYLIPGKNIAIWNSWTPLVLANNKVITPDNTLSLTRYDNGVPVVYQVGASDNPKNFTQLVKNVTYFIEAKTAYWLNNAVSPGTAAEPTPSKPAPAPAPTPAPAPSPSPAPSPASSPSPSPVENQQEQQNALAATRADLEQQLLVEATNRKEGDRTLLNQLQAAIEILQPSNQNLSSISKLACTAFGLGFLALENSQQGRDKIGALSLEDLNTALSSLQLLISGKQPLSDALSLLASIGISDFATKLLTLDSEEELKKLIDFDKLTVPLLSELDSKQPLNEQLSAIALLKTTEFGRGLLALLDGASLLNQIGGASSEQLQHYAKLTADGIVPTTLLPLSLSTLASVKASDFGLALLTLRDAMSVRSSIGALSLEELQHYAKLTADGMVPVSLLPSSLQALASSNTADFGLALLALADATSVRNRIGAVAPEDLQRYARLTGDGTIPTSLLPNQSLVNVATVNSAEQMLALTDIQPGDTVIRRDLSTRKIFILLSLPASDLSNWERTGIGVQTLNGQSGPIVNLAAPDVGADPAGSAERVSQFLLLHQNDSSNPHHVTAAQIGADEAGSALKVNQFLVVHQSDLNNPHQVTASQIGAEPLGRAAQVTQLLQAHQNDLNNPHHVSASQIGAEVAGSVQQHEQSVNHPLVTSVFNGLMSAADKQKLDRITPDSFTSRKTTTFTTDTLAAQQIGNYSVGLAKSFNLLRVEASSPCRMRVYASRGYRAADSDRGIGVDLKLGNGLISEVVFAGQLAYDLDSTFGNSAQAIDALPIAVTNTGAAAVAITLKFTYLKLE